MMEIEGRERERERLGILKYMMEIEGRKGKREEKKCRWGFWRDNKKDIWLLNVYKRGWESERLKWVLGINILFCDWFS